MKRATGLGGIFFKVKDPAKTKAWYAKHLGFVTTDWGASFVWGDAADKTKLCRTEWSPFASDTDYFGPSVHDFMINYRVHDLKKLMEVLAKENVKIVGEIQEFEYGKFGWILDPEDRKLELWQPPDVEFTDAPHLWTERVTGIGGVFFKSKDPKAMKAWYADHLGVADTFRWNDLSLSNAKVAANTIWAPFKENTDYFLPSDQGFMFNYRVNDLEMLMAKLKGEVVVTVGKIDTYSYGKFGWIMDADGNKIELWEPVDAGFE
jgi:predicted enzyme related to lactoylglutathione lyase